MRIPRVLVPALFAATTLGSVTALAAEPSPKQPVQGEASGGSPEQARTRWNCYTVTDGVYRDWVTIWWGHTPEDAKWACDNWVSACANAHRGCYATPRD